MSAQRRKTAPNYKRLKRLSTHRFRKSTMLEVEPDARLAVEDCVEEEVAAYRLMRRFHRSPCIAGHGLVLIGVDEHETVVVVACQKQRLPRQPTATPREVAKSRFVEGAKRKGQRPVDFLEMHH